jgi:L-asparaginase / beta-aspartyl-peptidase
MHSLAIHGGAGTILKSAMTPEKEAAYSSSLEKALLVGEKILSSGGSAIDAVCASVQNLEDNPLFNAGKGSVFTNLGGHEMDASIMDGSNLMAGAVAGVTGVKNPVLLAKLIMEKTEHVMLAGIGAENLARLHKLEFCDDQYFYDEFRYKQWLSVKDTESTMLDHKDDKKFGTVGAVALDKHGNLAAATSTGGMTNKMFNRIGDTPIIGAGTYAANATCAISCTGHGEFFIRAVVAYDVACLMEYKGLSLEDACHEVVNRKLVKLGGEGGLIALDGKGNISLVFNSEGMYRGSVKSGEKPLIAIYK